MASFAVDRELSLEAYNHDLKARFFRHKQRGNGGRIDDDARRRYLRKAMCRYYHNAMTKPNGLQWLERPEWRYMSESDGDGDDDDNGDDIDTTPTTTTTWQCVGSGLQWLEGQEWRYVSESDDDDDDDNGDGVGDGVGDGDGVGVTPTPTPTPTPTWQCVERPREFKVEVRSGCVVAEPVSCVGGGANASGERGLAKLQGPTIAPVFI